MKIGRCIPILVLLAAFGVVRSGENALSPAQTNLRQALEAVQRSPESLEAHNRLARAWLRKALEVERLDCHVQAEAAARKALALDPKSLSARRLLIESLLGQGRHEAALERAEALNRENPDNLDVYGYIADAAIALGRYDQAETAAQWMLDLRPNRVEGYARGARLRELFGDLEGAADFLNRTFLGLPPDQPEAKAVTLAALARLLRLQGHLEEADRVLAQALQWLPQGPTVLLELARLREKQGRTEEAAAALRTRAEVSPGPERWYRLGGFLRRAGQAGEADAAMKRFEELALAARELPDNANLLLARHWAQQPSRAKEALALAESEMSRRRDIHTRAVWALALHANQRQSEALETIEEVLAVGTLDPEILDAAAIIRGN